jgi:predicted P-loop ATPase
MEISQNSADTGQLLISYTLFPDVWPKTKIDRSDVEWQELVTRIRASEAYPDKAHCPLVSLCEYGELLSNSAKQPILRHAANVVRAYGAELDYDGELISPERGAAMLEAARLRAVIYTSPSHIPAKPRWRAILPFSEAAPPEKRGEYLARANRALGGIASRESFTLSQSFYIGRVRGANYQVYQIEGRCVDQAVDLEPQYYAGFKANGTHARDETTDEQLRRNIQEGHDRHQSCLSLSSRLAAKGMTAGDIAALLGELLGPNSLNADGVNFSERVGGYAETAVRKYGESRRKVSPPVQDNTPFVVDEDGVIQEGARQPAVKASTRAQPLRAAGATVSETGMIEDDGSAYAWWDKLGLQKTGNQTPYTNVVNVTAILKGHPEFAGKIWFDEFHRRTFFRATADSRREWTDGDDIRALIWIQQKLDIPKLTIEPVRHAVQAVAESNIRNEPREWLDSLEWDGTERLAHLMSDGFGAEYDEYTGAVGRCWLVGLVARIFKPGAKVDALPVFEGKEELGKSSALALIGSPWFAECHESITTKDFYQSIQGKALVEISELHAFRKADVDRLKGVISCQVDRYRESYGRRAEDHPRTCVFAGTTNRDNWNASDTGARRFWPIRCTTIDLEWLEKSKSMLFAEAVERFKRGEIWWDVPRVEARAQQESRRDRDAWEELIEKFITHERSSDPLQKNEWYLRKQPLEELTVSRILTEALRIEEGRWSRGDQMRVASALQALKWERKRRSDGWKYIKIREVEL